ncbi:MAG: GNAT family N-acetyltransferase [Lachnospiraceae bacterium]|nr:GNAT family N-acetyltransferase [Lachnospiraceae bacterium]
MNSRIRRAKDKDIPRLLELLVQVDMVHHKIRPDLFNGPATKYNEEELRGILRDEKSPVFVYTDEEDRVLGYAFCIYKQIIGDHVLTDIRTLYIDDICVDEQARGGHIGRSLYEYVIDFARKERFYNVTLNVWAGNDGAFAFYKNCGMQPQKYGMETIL